MVSREENELLTQVGPGTPSGEVFRRYWLPVEVSEKLKEKQLLPVRMLSEDLILFRDERGRAGLIGASCSHRGTDLRWGCVVNGGVRCIYHGWTFDIHGQCIDQPAEPKPFKEKVQHPAYPCEELGGLIFAYMGPPEKKPLLPQYDFLVRTDGVRVAYDAGYLHCNWLQRAENTMDPGHTSVLHGPAFDPLYSSKLEHQTYEFEETELGCRYIAIRDGRTEGTKFVRSAGLYLPCIRMDSHLYMPLPDSEPIVVHAIPNLDGAWRVPVDDYTIRDLGVTFYPLKEGESEEELRQKIKGRGYAVDDVNTTDENWIYDPKINKAKSVRWQDTVALIGQGKIADRSKEHLGSADRGVVLFRKIWMEQITAVKKGRDPKGIIRDPANNQLIETQGLGNALARSNGRSTEDVLHSVMRNCS
jgi:5,5'-dehydrodivanillate O-demethylase